MLPLCVAMALLACRHTGDQARPQGVGALPTTWAEVGSAPVSRHASVFERRGDTKAACDLDTLLLFDGWEARVHACPGAEEFMRGETDPPAAPRQREVWWALARTHAGDCAVQRNAASWLARRAGGELDRRLAPGHPQLVANYWQSGVMATVGSRTRSLETVQCAAEVLGPLPERLSQLHGLWLFRAGWVYLYAGKMLAYQRVHAELGRRESAFDRFVFAHLQGLEAIRAGDMARAEQMLLESVRRHPEELHEVLSGPSLLVREFWVRDRVDVVVDYLESQAEHARDEGWAREGLETVLAGTLPADGWL